MHELKQKRQWYLLFFAWLIAAIAMFGSLFFSEIMLFTPCVLCWYQRIAMYALVVILLVGILKNDQSVFAYARPLVYIGIFVALYHNLLHWEIIPESASPCIESAPCSTVYVDWFGFVTIPFMSLTAFTIIATLLYFAKRTK
jgi:disulfide bond formation protein DsbB